MSRRLLLGFSALFALACGAVPTPESPAPPRASAGLPVAAAPVDELDRPLALDARVLHGKLPSGLSYYVLPHQKPEKRAQVWLAVNAGSVLEDDDQRGLAHFVEHMGFNGTKRFPKQQLVDFLEKSGVRFGADLNAYTSFDETVYTLQVPTDDVTVLERSIGVLRDWADGISFERAEVEKERGVVLEEWRLGRGARMRVFDKQAPVVFFGSKYAERLTIGKPEIIQRASRDTLLRFYRDWYRPDLMAVIAVGDFDAKAVEAKIKAEFASLANPAKPRPRTRVTLPAHGKTLVSIETDPELTSTTVAVMSKLPHRPEASARDYRRAVVEQLIDAMLDARLDELERKPEAPFLNASSSTSGLLRTADAFRQTATVKDDGVFRGMTALLEEIARAERHGFVQSELERAKSQLLRNFQQAAKERAKRDASEYAAEITRHFFEAEAMPGREAELALVERFLPTIEVSELNGRVKELGAGSRLMAVTGPDKMPKPKAQELLALVEQVRAKKLEAYADLGSNQPLMQSPPKAGSVVTRRSIAEVGVTEWTLSNGARVVIKPTDFANDDVRMAAISPGGHSLAKDADFESARFADVAVGQGGLGPFDVVQLRKALAGKLVSVSAKITELEEGLSGRAAPADLETLLQMMHLAFVAPRRDREAFAAWQAREVEGVKNRRLSPEGAFFEELANFTVQNHPRRRVPTAESLQKVDLERAFSVYQDRFADASDFTFVFVGNIEPGRLESLVVTYLASLPSKKRNEKWRDLKVTLPAGVKTKIVKQGSEPKSMVSLTFHGVEKWSRDTENEMRALGEVLRLRLRQVLREDMGGVYGVQVGGFIARRPRPEYRFSVSFGCAPENVTKLEQAVFDEIAAVQRDGVQEDYIAKVKEARRRAHQTELRDNGYWLRELERAWIHGDDPRQIVDIEPMLAKVSSSGVRAAARKYISKKQYLLGVLEPETPSKAP